MEIVIFFSLVASFAFSLGTILSKVALSAIKNRDVALFYQLSVNFLLILTLFFGIQLVEPFPFGDLGLNDYFIMIISAVLVYIALLFSYLGLERGNVSVGKVISSTRVGFSIIFAYVLLAEVYSLYIYQLILVMLVGVISVSWHQELELKDFITLKGGGIIWFIISAFFMALSNYMLSSLQNAIAVHVIMLFRLTTLFSISLIHTSWLKLYTRQDMNFKIDRRILGYIVIYVICYIIGDFFLITAFGISLTISEAIMTTQAIITFILILGLSQFESLKELIAEPLDQKTLLIRFIGIIIAVLATLSLINSLNGFF
ncbi:MAG: EamA family transporter [Candidatus Heimdallarchaeota archaeon]|nr:MAG: EamA family transporter [Candidatus Heimdallarchaeota archaeon]